MTPENARGSQSTQQNRSCEPAPAYHGDVCAGRVKWSAKSSAGLELTFLLEKHLKQELLRTGSYLHKIFLAICV